MQNITHTKEQTPRSLTLSIYLKGLGRNLLPTLSKPTCLWKVDLEGKPGWYPFCFFCNEQRKRLFVFVFKYIANKASLV